MSETTVLTFGYDTVSLSIIDSGRHLEEIDWNLVFHSKKLVISGSVDQLNKISSQMMNPNSMLGSHSNVHFEFREDLYQNLYHDRGILSSIEGLEVLLERLSVSNVKTLMHPTCFIKLDNGHERVKYKVFECDETLPSLFEEFFNEICERNYKKE